MKINWENIDPQNRKIIQKVTNDFFRNSKISHKIEPGQTTVSNGETIDHKINYKNIGSKDLKDVLVKVVLPQGLDFVNSNQGNFSKDESALTVNIGDLASDTSGSINISTKVADDVKDKDILVVAASIIYTNPENNTQEDAIDYALLDVVKKDSNLAAASIFGNGDFLPNTLIGWITLLQALGAIVMIGQKLYM